MKKAELIDAIFKDITELDKKKVTEVINEFMETIKRTLKEGDKITLVGFGTFKVKDRKATTGVNPKTREKINIPAKRVAKLEFSSVVNNMLNDKTN